MLYSITNIKNKTQVVQWGANVLHRMQTYLWIGLKGNICISPNKTQTPSVLQIY